MSEVHCHKCEYTRVPGIGLRSPPFFGPKPADMNPCEECWSWKEMDDTEQERHRPCFSRVDIDAAVSAEREACFEVAGDEFMRYPQHDRRRRAAERIMEAIRARGKP